MDGYRRSEWLEETGYVVLDRHDRAIDPSEWLDLDYVDWKSSGDTRFAPLASAFGAIECGGFWSHNPPRGDRDGVWIGSQAEKAPTLVRRALEPGVNVGRCRIIELQPNSYADCLYNLHLDDNNRLNPPGSGWVVRSFLNLTDDRDSCFVLREKRGDPRGETRIALPAGTRLIVDSQRLWHAVVHRGPAPRYCLVTSWESGPALDDFISSRQGRVRVASVAFAPSELLAGQVEQERRDGARAAFLAENRRGEAALARSEA